MKTAVVFIDVQNDFISGTCLGTEEARTALPKIVEFAKSEKEEEGEEEGCKSSETMIYATRDTHVATLRSNDEAAEPVSGYLATLEGKKLPVEHCISGSFGWLVAEDLWKEIASRAVVIDKPSFGSFQLASAIARDFKSSEPEKIVLCGFYTDICVISNALILRAAFPNTKIEVRKDLCAGSSKKKHEAALAVMESCQIEIV